MLTWATQRKEKMKKKRIYDKDTEMIRKSCQHCENIKIRTKFVFTMEMEQKIKWKQNEKEKKTKCKDYKERWSYKSKKVRLVW